MSFYEEEITKLIPGSYIEVAKDMQPYMDHFNFLKLLPIGLLLNDKATGVYINFQRSINVADRNFDDNILLSFKDIFGNSLPKIDVVSELKFFQPITLMPIGHCLYIYSPNGRNLIDSRGMSDMRQTITIIPDHVYKVEVGDYALHTINVTCKVYLLNTDARRKMIKKTF